MYSLQTLKITQDCIIIVWFIQLYFLKNKKEQKYKKIKYPPKSEKGQSKLIGTGRNVNKKEGQGLNRKKKFFKKLIDKT